MWVLLLLYAVCPTHFATGCHLSEVICVPRFCFLSLPRNSAYHPCLPTPPSAVYYTIQSNAFSYHASISYNMWFVPVSDCSFNLGKDYINSIGGGGLFQIFRADLTPEMYQGLIRALRASLCLYLLIYNDWNLVLFCDSYGHLLGW